MAHFPGTQYQGVPRFPPQQNQQNLQEVPGPSHRAPVFQHPGYYANPPPGFRPHGAVINAPPIYYQQPAAVPANGYQRVKHGQVRGGLSLKQADLLAAHDRGFYNGPVEIPRPRAALLPNRPLPVQMNPILLAPLPNPQPAPRPPPIIRIVDTDSEDEEPPPDPVQKKSNASRRVYPRPPLHPDIPPDPVNKKNTGTRRH